MKRTVSITISVLATIVLGWWLLRAVSLAELLAALKQLPLSTLVIALVGYAVINLVRGVRAKLLLGAFTVKELFFITNIHNMFVNLLPARTGELSYFLMLKKRGITLGATVGTLAAARVFDLFGIALILLVASLATPLPTPLAQLELPLLLVVGALIAFLILVLVFHDIIKRQFTGTSWFSRKCHEILESIHRLRSGKRVAGVFTCAVVIWMLQFSINTMVFQSLGLPIPLMHGFLAGALAALISAVPIQGIVGFGTTEAIWTVALVSIGITAEQGIAAGFVQHVVSLIASVVLGIVGWVGLRKS